MRFKIFSRALLLFGLMALPLVDNVSAQTLGASDIQSILQGVAQQPGAPPQQSNSQPLTSSTQTIQPAATIAVSQTTSSLEQHFSDRAGVPLKQFGYDTFGAAGTVTATQV